MSEISRKVSTRLYFLKQLKIANVETKDLVTFYVTYLRLITEYACAVFHNSLPNFLSDELEHLQMRAMRIILPFTKYQKVLELINLETLFDRRQALTAKLFQHISSDPSHKLYKLLPEANKCCYSSRNNRKFQVPSCKTKRLQNIFYANCT